MDELRATYRKQLSEYDALVTSAIASQDASQIPKIKELNTAISKTLNDMIEKSTYLKKETPDLTKLRDELVGKLRKIQQDYNGLLANTDTLETLRRIRQQESSSNNKELYWYLIFFFGLAFILFLYVLFFTYKKETTAAIASTPPMTAALV
jgi:hypothetical protein